MNAKDQRELEELYRVLARKTHPDFSKHPDAAQDFVDLNTAYRSKALMQLKTLAHKYKVEGY